MEENWNGRCGILSGVILYSFLLSMCIWQSLSGVGGVLIDVLSQNKQNSSSSSAQNFAASVIKEKIIDNNHIDLEIPDTIVGAILGPRAKTLAEIQHLSGCKVEVHKRGTAAGQGNRLVSLTGDVDCIRNGRMMIDKVINDEQMRRNQQAQSNARGGFRSIHYFRIHHHYWNDRLQRIRSAGLNAIQMYIPWNFHEIYNGRYLFNGQRNITHFIELAASYQLFVLARIGPYICAEWENGGLPWWLIHKYGGDIHQRTSDKRFLKEVERWFNVLLPILRKQLLKNGGPILMVQVENEYGSHYACDKVYMKRLSDIIRFHLGSDIVQYTTDGSAESYLKCGTISGVYPTIDFGPTSRQNVDAYFALQRRYAPRGPLVNSEFYPGWLVVWGQKDQKLPSISEIIDTANYMYHLGANINFYMFHGGTNFGYWNGAEVIAPVITSYDYSAPLTEAGDLTQKYMAIRNWLASKWDWPYKPGSIPRDNLKIGYGSIKLKNILPLGKNFWELIPKNEDCQRTKYPLSFEHLQHPFGFVLYYTTLKFGGTNLTIPILKDRGYVLIDNELQGVLVNRFGLYWKHWINIRGARKGAKLGILVENHGRQTIPTINDFKGILTNATLDGQIIDDWVQCGLHPK
ncbi:Beta-galactosidase [Dirofilaria immitis]|nr:Beta-galactosidase [Dirofilaria immitis]